jgi:GGDEF domain-containing protein
VQQHAFSDAHRRLVELVAGAAADALATALAQAAVGDALTSTPPAHEQSLDALLHRDGLWSSAGGHSLGVLFLRADASGDAMAHASMAINQATRVADLIFRVRPDELVVLMPDCDAAAGQIIAERLAETLATLPDGARTVERLQLGFACSPFDGSSLRDLLEVSRRRANESPRESFPSWVLETRSVQAGGAS